MLKRMLTQCHLPAPMPIIKMLLHDWLGEEDQVSRGRNSTYLEIMMNFVKQLR
jgi:hypothetical protein